MTKNTIFWLIIWGTLVGVSIGVAAYIPVRQQRLDDEVRIIAAEHARIQQELQLIEQMRQAELDVMQEMAMPKTPDEFRVADLEAFAESLEAYYKDARRYPIVSGESDDLVALTTRESPCSDLLIGHYVDACPRDPAWPDLSYKYRSIDGFTYELTALMDDVGSARCMRVDDLCVFLIYGGVRGLLENEPPVLKPFEDSFEDEDEDIQPPVVEEISASLHRAVLEAYK